MNKLMISIYVLAASLTAALIGVLLAVLDSNQYQASYHTLYTSTDRVRSENAQLKKELEEANAKCAAKPAAKISVAKKPVFPANASPAPVPTGQPYATATAIGVGASATASVAGTVTQPAPAAIPSQATTSLSQSSAVATHCRWMSDGTLRLKSDPLKVLPRDHVVKTIAKSELPMGQTCEGWKNGEHALLADTTSRDAATLKH